MTRYQINAHWLDQQLGLLEWAHMEFARDRHAGHDDPIRCVAVQPASDGIATDAHQRRVVGEKTGRRRIDGRRRLLSSAHHVRTPRGGAMLWWIVVQLAAL